MRKRSLKWIVAFALALLIVWVMGQVDYERLLHGERPIFARVVLHANDGGSVHFLGVGYTVTSVHQLRWGIEMQNEAVTNMSYSIAPFAPYRVGSRLNYWTPFVSRERTRFLIETNQ
jgi:hypothetical protein